MNLPKPLAILHRPTTQEDQDDTMREDADGPGDQSSKGSKEWNIVTIVKRKMVFSRRPMPMVGHVTAPTSSSGRKS